MTKTAALSPFVEETRQHVELILPKYLPSASSEPREMHAAMRYAALAGGKRLRPLLACAAYRFAGGSREREEHLLEPAMASLEIIHTYSLIHDDLPCMDDDDLRRGQPTVHRKFSEAIAVLAGDALHVVAFRLMAETGSIPAVLELADAVGTSGMIGGQIADLEAEGKKISREQIQFIHRKKTGALIRASVVIGGMLAEASSECLSTFRQFGEKIGLAFQIVDDILDLEGDTELLGKPVGSDLKNDKATYPAVVGMEQAKIDARQLIDEAIRLVEMYDCGRPKPSNLSRQLPNQLPDHLPNHLIELARFVSERAY